MYYISQRDNVEEVKRDEDSDADAITDNNVYEEPHGLELHVMQRHQRLRMETEIWFHFCVCTYCKETTSILYENFNYII